MKKARRRFSLVLVVILFAFGCTAPYGPDLPSERPGNSGPGELGAIRILRVDGTNTSGAASVAAQSALPEVEHGDIGQLRITLHQGPEDAPNLSVSIDNPSFDNAGKLESPVEITDIVPGEWQLTVEALDAASRVLLRGVSDVTVRAGEFTELVSVAVTFVEDGEDGSWELTVEWPAEDNPSYPITDVVDVLAWRVGSEGEWHTLNVDGVYTQTVNGTVSPGDHLISVELRAGDKPAPFSTVARYDEIWRVYSHVTTRKTLSFVENDFAYGGGARITITIDNPEDLDVFFQDVPDSTVIAGSPYKINAAEIAGATHYRWRVNGEDIDQGPEKTQFTIETSHGDAGKVLLVVLVVEVNGRLYSGSHRVRVEAPGAP